MVAALRSRCNGNKYSLKQLLQLLKPRSVLLLLFVEPSLQFDQSLIDGLLNRLALLCCLYVEYHSMKPAMAMVKRYLPLLEPRFLFFRVIVAFHARGRYSGLRQ
jgi:hypothetical protein